MKELLLTEKGEKALGVKDSESNRHGGPEHRYWVKAIAEHLRANGYNVAKEVPVGGGKAIDIVATQNDKQIAFEIESGKSDASINIEKCLEAGLNRIVVVTTSTKADKMVRASSADISQVEVIRGNQALSQKW